MKTSALALALLGLFPAALAQSQSAGPSPTESWGCEPHGDHYHCEGLRATLRTSVTSAVAAATTTHGHDDEDEHSHSAGTGSIGPSPTESWGCEPHGDHYHCEGSRTTLTSGVTAASAATTTTHRHHDDETAAASAGASPTESYGCEPHGDHWHCDGARSTTAGSGTRSTSTGSGTRSTSTGSGTAGSTSTRTTSGSTAQATGNSAGMAMVPVLGLAAAAVLVL